jgi:hypothetical protein
MEHTEQEIIEHCAKLLWGVNWAQSNSEDETVERFNDDEGCYYLPKGLTDEDKFLCILLIESVFFYNLSAKTFMLLFGWTRYKTRKIRKTFSFIRNVTCLCESTGGYYGKAWGLTYEFMQKIKELQKSNKPCSSCDLLKIYVYGRPYEECPISKEVVHFKDSAYCDQIKLEITESFNNFWK